MPTPNPPPILIKMALSSMSIVTSSKSELSLHKIAYYVLEEEPKMILHDKGIIPNQPLAHFSLLDFPTIGLQPSSTFSLYSLL
jgi:hypothetical protein